MPVVRSPSVSAPVAGIDSTPAQPTVVACYAVFDSFFPALGLSDLSDGMYEGKPQRSYAVAQALQAECLLDRAAVSRGSRLLDVGCGYGRILHAARARGARGLGITVSPEQVRRCTADGLSVRRRDYRHLGPEWDGQFDAVIVNGSLEHFVSPRAAAIGQDDEVYQELFATVHRLLDPTTVRRRFVTTAIHFRERPKPRDLLMPPEHHARESPSYHFARLAQSYSGWYPTTGQLEDCARGYFRLIDEEDGTEDYRLTSEAWLATARRMFRSPRLWLQFIRALVRHPVHTVRMMRCTLGSESWNWQFRGDPPPTMLLRQTWQAR